MATNRPSTLSLGLAPLMLRLVIGITFTWSGLAKWFGEATVQGEDAALLANMGIVEMPHGAAPAPAASPSKPLPAPAPGGATAPGGTLLILAQASAGGGTPAPVTAASVPATAADFPEPVSIRPMWRLAVMLHHAAHPGMDEKTGQQKMALWPRAIGEGLWPKYLAIAVFVAELGGGALVLLGLFTRLGAFAVISVMLGAMWLTQFGPAIQSGNAKLGFLPDHDWWDTQAWTTLLFQFALFGCALALIGLRCGALAVDRAIVGARNASAAPARPAGGQGGGAGAAGGGGARAKP